MLELHRYLPLLVFLLSACDAVHHPGRADATADLPTPLLDATADTLDTATGNAMDSEPPDEGTPDSSSPPDISAPDAAPSDTPQQPEAISDAKLETAADISPDVAPDVSPDVAPDISPDVAPDVPPVGKIPVLMAQGYVGRTIMSCDDGLTWVNNHAFDVDADAHVCGSTEPVQCWGAPCTYFNIDTQTCQPQDETFCDCDHHPGNGTGIAFGGSYFVTTWGWGPKGSLRRSTNGLDWEMVAEGSPGLAGLAFGQGRFIGGSGLPHISDDGGATWQSGNQVTFESPTGAEVHNARRSGYVDVAGGRFIITAQTGSATDVRLSSDLGETWWQPTSLPPQCGTYVTAIIGGGEHIVISHLMGEVCASHDGGATFTIQDLGEGEFGPAVFDGDKFLMWSLGGTRFESPTGATWTQTPPTGQTWQLENIGFNPETGTLVGVALDYSNQVFVRSVDGGLTWSALPTGSFPTGHAIGTIVFGWADPTPDCVLQP